MPDLDLDRNTIVLGDSLEVLRSLPDGSFHLIYIDPPFNTGTMQRRVTLRTIRDEEGGDRVGYGRKRYRSTIIGEKSYPDVHCDYIGFLRPRLVEARRVLTGSGSLFFHIDFREAHYCKVLLDEIFSRQCFINEIIWAYDYGGRPKRRWPAKHDSIFWYTADAGRYTFNYDAIDRVPYLAPGLAGAEKAARGKTPTDVWWHTIVSPTGTEKTGYPNQKPLAIVERIVRVHSNAGERVLDFFAGSGTTGEAAARLRRKFFLVDENPEAVGVMRARLRRFSPAVLGMPGGY